MNLKHDITMLVQLQEIDTAISAVEGKIKALPTTLTALEERVEKITTDKKNIADKIAILATEENKNKMAIAQDVAHIQKSKDKLMLITSKKEYNAVVKEIDSLEKSNRVHEEEKLLLYEELTLQQQELAVIESHYTQHNDELVQAQATYEPKLTSYTKELAKLQTKRNTLAKTISSPILERYEFIRSRMPIPVLAFVTKGVCQVCRVTLPSQLQANLICAQQIYTCPSCQRILYIE